jgi:hypothetical protein
LLLLAPVGSDCRAHQWGGDRQSPPQPTLLPQLLSPGCFRGLQGLHADDFGPPLCLNLGGYPIKGSAAAATTEQRQQPPGGYPGITQGHVDALGAHRSHRVGRIAKQQQARLAPALR